MRIIMYGTKNCPDVREALAVIAKKQLDVEFRNFDDSVKNLKEFISLRDRSPEFDEIKRNGTIGIPCFIGADGTISFDTERL